jgi:hypothetical protein
MRRSRTGRLDRSERIRRFSERRALGVLECLRLSADVLRSPDPSRAVRSSFGASLRSLSSPARNRRLPSGGSPDPSASRVRRLSTLAASDQFAMPNDLANSARDRSDCRYNATSSRRNSSGYFAERQGLDHLGIPHQPVHRHRRSPAWQPSRPGTRGGLPSRGANAHPLPRDCVGSVTPWAIESV